MDTKTIGNKIAKARRDKNISQAQLAEALFLSPQAIGKWERGESTPDLITVNRLAAILDVDLNYFSESTPDAAALDSVQHSAQQQQAPLPGKQQKKLNWNMSRGNWVDADFSGLQDLHEKFSSSHMLRCKFIGSDLSGLLLKNNHVESCDFSNSNISNSHVQSTHLAGNNFNNSLLTGTEFTESDINSCDFSDANFEGVVIKNSAFRKNTADNVAWQQTVFNGTHISDVVFNSTIENCYFENCAFARVTFQNLTLINTFFKCKNLKGITFVDCFADRLTYEFLKNGKADLNGVSMLRV